MTHFPKPPYPSRHHLMRRVQRPFIWTLPVTGDVVIRIVGETIQISEVTPQHLRTLVREAPETVEVSESRQRLILLVRSQGDTVELSEATQRLRRLVLENADTVNIAEAIAFVRAIFTVVSEIIELAEASQRLRLLDRETAETVETAEAVQRLRLLDREATETVQLAEGLIRVRKLIRVQSDTVEIAEGALHSLAGLILVQIINEIGNVSEATQRLRLLDREAAETVQVSEATDRIRRLISLVSETEQVAETLTRIRRLVTPVDETVEIAEEIERLLAALRKITIQGRRDVLLRIQGRQDVLQRIQGQQETAIRVQGRLAVAVTESVEFFRGEDVTLEEEITTTGVSGGPAEDINGWALVFSLKRHLSETIVLTKTIGSGITIQGDGSAGRADIVLTDDDTNTLVPGDYVYDVRRDDPGNEAVVTVGTLTVKEKVGA